MKLFLLVVDANWATSDSPAANSALQISSNIDEAWQLGHAEEEPWTDALPQSLGL
jgi:hypothetical protein